MAIFFDFDIFAPILNSSCILIMRPKALAHRNSNNWGRANMSHKVKKVNQNDTWVPSHIVNEYTDSCISVFEGHPSITCDKSALKVSQMTHLNFGVPGRLIISLKTGPE